MRQQVYKARTIRLLSQVQIDAAVLAIKSTPVDAGLEVVIRPEVKARKLDQNAAMWAGPLRDIAEQAWSNDRQYIAEVWHEYFKRQYLPDENTMPAEELALRVKDPETYRKWDIDPSGERVLVGSTTQLTVFGFAEYLRQIEAEGAGMGVLFTASPRMAA